MAVLVTLILPAHVREGDQVTLAGTGFSASNNAVEVSGNAATITAQSTTSITFTAPGGLTEDQHNTLLVTNQDDSTFQARHLFVLKSAAAYAADSPPEFHPGGSEGFSDETAALGEAKDMNRLAGLLEAVVEDAVLDPALLYDLIGTEADAFAEVSPAADTLAAALSAIVDAMPSPEDPDNPSAHFARVASSPATANFLQPEGFTGALAHGSAAQSIDEHGRYTSLTNTWSLVATSSTIAFDGYPTDFHGSGTVQTDVIHSLARPRVRARFRAEHTGDTRLFIGFDSVYGASIDNLLTSGVASFDSTYGAGFTFFSDVYTTGGNNRLDLTWHTSNGNAAGGGTTNVVDTGIPYVEDQVLEFDVHLVSPGKVRFRIRDEHGVLVYDAAETTNADSGSRDYYAGVKVSRFHPSADPGDSIMRFYAMDLMLYGRSVRPLRTIRDHSSTVDSGAPAVDALRVIADTPAASDSVLAEVL